MVAETALSELPIGPEELGPLALHAHLAGTGRWERFAYSGPAGSRRFFVYSPAGYTLDQRVPMVVMLHGCTQTPADSAAGTAWNLLADRQTFVVVYPEQTIGDNLLSCWNWFLPEHQARGSGEAGILAGITQQVLTSDTRWNIDPGRMYVCGISAGGAMAVILGATHPDLYAAVGIHAGVSIGRRPTRSPPRARWPTAAPIPSSRARRRSSPWRVAPGRCPPSSSTAPPMA
jgi:poly(3-hydroxybutyrate) depolymerase